MKVLIVGAGLSGCVLARVLNDQNYHVSMIEKENHIGGLCITRFDKNGMKYEPFGARTFHSSDTSVIDFAKRFAEFNGYTHRKGMLINNILFPFPLSKGTLHHFEEKEQIFHEIAQRPNDIDRTNFETACISIFGKTLYRYFVKNYTKKMWGCDPRHLTSEWAPKRLELRDGDDDRLFKDQWQGLPKDGYTNWLKNMVDDISVQLGTTEYNVRDFDIILTSAPIDQLFGYEYGELEYRSLDFTYAYDETWERDNYGTINLPQHDTFFRKCNFSILHLQNSIQNLVQYQKAVPVNNGNMPMYPVNTKPNHSRYNLYLKKICKNNMIIPTGRLGLFKYLDMDKAIEVAFEMGDLVKRYSQMTPEDRYSQIQKMRKRY